MRSSINIAHRASVHVEIMPRAPSVLQGSDHPNQTSWPSYLVQFSRTPHISLLGLLEGWLWLATLGALLLLLVLHRSAYYEREKPSLHRFQLPLDHNAQC
uniref:Uncharacterized protein n=1 Tax=Opuntia streptacantha TaxID=393608 RepID=A0A7C8ZSP5_OPUST